MTCFKTDIFVCKRKESGKKSPRKNGKLTPQFSEYITILLAYLNAVWKVKMTAQRLNSFWLRFYLKRGKQKLELFDIVKLVFVLCFEEYEGYLAICSITLFIM